MIPALALVLLFAPVDGSASWFDHREGEAAAGPVLRAAIGPGWRGSIVRVCRERCVNVRLTDWCQCYRGTPRERVIDLDRGSFARLGDIGRGVLRVTVYPLVVEPPATDTASVAPARPWRMAA